MIIVHLLSQETFNRRVVRCPRFRLFASDNHGLIRFLSVYHIIRGVYALSSIIMVASVGRIVLISCIVLKVFSDNSGFVSVVYPRKYELCRISNHNDITMMLLG